MFRLIFSKNGNFLIEKSIKRFSPSKSIYCVNLHMQIMHDLHNIWKTLLGTMLGSHTYTIKDNYYLIGELIEYKKMGKLTIISDNDIITFIKMNIAGYYKGTTVFFENHWKYRFVLANFSILYLDYFAHIHGTSFLLGICLHLITLIILPWCSKGSVVLEDMAYIRKKLQNELNIEKINNFSSKKNNDKNIGIFATQKINKIN